MKRIVLFYPRPWPGRTMSGRLPYSLLMLYDYLRDAPFAVGIVDQRLSPDIETSINSAGDEFLCFGISSFTGIQIQNGLAIATVLKKRYPLVPIVWGGWHPSSIPDQTLHHPLVDIVVRGQGEAAFKELAYALSEGKDLSAVEGVSFKRDGQIVHNPERKVQSLAEHFKLPFEALDVEKYIYRKAFAGRSDKTIGIITSLGCPNNCGFCAVCNIYKRHVFYRDMSNVIAEIDTFVTKYGVTSLTIDDDNFFVSPSRVMSFCKELIARPYRVTWDAGVSAELLLNKYDNEALRLIRKSGCEQLYIGAESGSDDVLEMINKKARVAHTYKFVAAMKAIGIRASISAQVGLPGVPSQEIFDTIDMIIKCREINPDFDYRLFYYTPYPSTPLYTKAVECGYKEPASLEAWANHSLRKFKAPWIKKKYRRLVKYFYFYFYPYSGSYISIFKAKSRIGKLFAFFCRVVFENGFLRRMATWRVRNRRFGFPLDAAFAVSARRLLSMYDRIVNKNIDIFHEFDS